MKTSRTTYRRFSGSNESFAENVGDEFGVLPEKTTPVNADVVVVEDSASGRTKKRVQVGNLPGGGGGGDLVDDTTPQLGGMLDVNGQAIGDGTRELLEFGENASAVNHIKVQNSAADSGPSISAVGDDTNINLRLFGKGTGIVWVVADFFVSGDIDLSGAVDGRNVAGDGTKLDGIEAGARSGDVTGPGSSTDNTIARFDSTTGKIIQGSGVVITDLNAVSGITRLDVDNLRFDANLISSTDTNGPIRVLPNGTGRVTVGNAGDVVIGDATERDMRPQTTLKVNLGTTSLRFNDLFTGGLINLASLPTTDPGVVGQLWRSSTDLKISI